MLNSKTAQRVLIWDLPTRLFHWLLALSFIVAYFSADSERWALVHITCGYTFLALIIFRLIWGFAGSRYARFSEFVFKPSAVLRYLAGLFHGRPSHYAGHNPAGSLAILAVLSLGLTCGVSGWLIYAEDVCWLDLTHEASAKLIMALVLVHVFGVLVSSRLHRENLVRAMIDGKKKLDAASAISSQHTVIALLLLTSLSVFWLWSFRDSLNVPTYVNHLMAAISAKIG